MAEQPAHYPTESRHSGSCRCVGENGVRRGLQVVGGVGLRGEFLRSVRIEPGLPCAGQCRARRNRDLLVPDVEHDSGGADGRGRGRDGRGLLRRRCGGAEAREIRSDVHVAVQPAGRLGDLASGVLTPQPCQPVLSPWSPGSARATIGEIAALDDSSTCTCAWAGVVPVSDARQTDVDVQ